MVKRKVQIEYKRCSWVNNDEVYIQYHDEEWGTPEFDKIKLFEMICLEGQQAGLSWITVLKKRHSYRELFCHFDPKKINSLQKSDVEKLANDVRIIRHKAKIQAIINNAKCYLDMENKGENFATFIWSFVDHKPVINNWKDLREVPTTTVVSDSLSRALKQRGFKFVGSTTCYAFMQACGLVNDHISSCLSRNTSKKTKFKDNN